MWNTKPKMFVIWPFTEKVHQALDCVITVELGDEILGFSVVSCLVL